MPLASPLRILFIVNPISGSGSRTELEKTMSLYFQDSPHPTEYYELNGENDATSITYWIDNWKPDRIVAAGGDGTLKTVASLLIGKNIPLGILPAGSANGMAKELGIPEDFTQCLDIVTGEHSERIDLIRINDNEICMHLSDLGLNAHLVKHFEESDRRGMWGYAREVWKVMRRKEQFRVQIKTSEKTIVHNAWMVVIANARMYGTGAMINPQGNLKDGLMEIIILRKLSIWELLKMLIKNRRFNPRKTELIQTASSTISVQQSAHFQVDGEYRGTLNTIKASVIPNAILVMMPELTTSWH